jgi:hypothetical protein
MLGDDTCTARPTEGLLARDDGLSAHARLDTGKIAA